MGNQTKSEVLGQFWASLRSRPVSQSGVSGIGGHAQRDSSSNSILDTVHPDYPRQCIGHLQKLVLINPNISQALKKHIHLANTGLEFLLEGASDKDQEQGQLEIRSLLNNQPGLINHLLRQIIISGALSAEAVPALDLDEGIEQVCLVPADKIYFRKEVIEDREYFFPYQLVNHGSYVKLNEKQYSYEALECSDENPYGIPPFVSAMRHALLSYDITGNVSQILDRMGLLGVIDVEKERPKVNSGETQESYQARLKNMLSDLVGKIKNSFKRGILVHYDDTKIKHSNTSVDTRGFNDIYRSVEEQFASGLDTDPALLGRSYSTTETYAGVQMNAFEAKLANIRQPVERFLKKAITLHLRLKGYRFERVSAKWGPAASRNRLNDAQSKLAEAQAEEARIRSIIAKRDQGIIDQEQAAKELGYEQAASDKPEQVSLQASNVSYLADAKKKRVAREQTWKRQIQGSSVS